MARSGPLDLDGFEFLLTLLSEPSPPMQVRLLLGHLAQRQVPWTIAWGTVMRTMPRRGDDAAEWRRSLHATRAAWESAYMALLDVHEGAVA